MDLHFYGLECEKFSKVAKPFSPERNIDFFHLVPAILRKDILLIVF